MIGSQTFLLAHLVLTVVVLVWIGVAERLGRKSFHSLNKGVRYRRMSTDVALKLIHKRKR